MARVRQDKGASEKARLLQRAHEGLGLRWLDNIVLKPEGQQKFYASIGGNCIADGRGFEIKPPVVHRRRTKISFHEIVAGTHLRLMLPLGQHVVDTIAANDELHRCGVSARQSSEGGDLRSR